jgi:hypothetical protein
VNMKGREMIFQKRGECLYKMVIYFGSYFCRANLSSKYILKENNIHLYMYTMNVISVTRFSFDVETIYSHCSC